MELDSLTGSFLISSSAGDALGGVFRRSVVYIAEHGENGTYGFIVNKVIPRGKQLLAGSLTVKGGVHGLFLGGPVSPRRLCVIFTVNGRVIVSASKLDIEANFTQQNHGRCKFLVGCASWGPGDLYEEIKNHYWHVVPAAEKYIFSDYNFISDLEKEKGLHGPFLIANCGNT